MAIQTLSLITEVAIKLYETGELARMVSDYEDGIVKLFQGAAGTYVQGNDGSQFMLHLQYPGSYSAILESSTLMGSVGSESVQSPTYRRQIVLRRLMGGQVAFSSRILEHANSPGSAVNEVLDIIGGHIQFISRHDLWTTIYGASGFLVRVGSGSKTVVSGNIFNIPIDTASGADTFRWSQTPNGIYPGTHVQIVHKDTHAILSGSITGTPYAGVVRGVNGNAEDALDIEWDVAQPETNTDLTNDYVVRVARRAGTQEKYGLVDFVGDFNTTYVNDAGVSTNAFPYASGETGIDPDIQKEWQSTVTTHGGSFGVADLDDLYERRTRRHGTGSDLRKIVCVAPPDVITKLKQERRAYLRYEQGSPENQHASMRNVFDGDKQFQEVPIMPFNTIYMVSSRHLSYDQSQRNGPKWEVSPDLQGNRTGGIFLRGRSTQDYSGHTAWDGNRMTLLRGAHAVSRPS